MIAAVDAESESKVRSQAVSAHRTGFEATGAPDQPTTPGTRAITARSIYVVAAMLALGISTTAMAKSDRAPRGQGHDMVHTPGNSATTGTAKESLESEVMRKGRIIVIDPDGVIVEPLRRVPNPADY